MSGAPTIVMKGAIIREIDLRLQRPKPEFLTELAAMGGSDRLSDLALDNDHGTITRKQKPHVDVDWFGQGKGWWPDLPNKEKIMRATYMRALGIALSYTNVPPIRSYWIAGIPKTFQCYVHDSTSVGGAVNVFWVTPAVPKVGAAKSDETLSDLWVIGSESDIEAIRSKFPDGYDTEEPEPVGDGVVIFKSTGY